LRDILQNGATLSHGFVGPQNQRHRAEHKHDGAPRGSFRKDVGCAPGPKSSLTAGTPERTGQVCRLAALQQDNDDQHQAIQDEKPREQPAGEPEAEDDDAKPDEQGHGPLQCHFCIHFKNLY
jgi:hypothetical protein